MGFEVESIRTSILTLTGEILENDQAITREYLQSELDQLTSNNVSLETIYNYLIRKYGESLKQVLRVPNRYESRKTKITYNRDSSGKIKERVFQEFGDNPWRKEVIFENIKIY